MSDIEEKNEGRHEKEMGQSNREKTIAQQHTTPGEFDNHQSHQLQDANKNITKARALNKVMHDNSNSSSHYSYSNNTTTATSMLQKTELSQNDLENEMFYNKGKHLISMF